MLCQRMYKGYHLYADVKDGSLFSQKLLLQDPSVLSIILYQDSFEVVNPLGSGGKNHKVLAAYMTLGNILPHNRSNIDHMQLVLLCREEDFKFFGTKSIFNRLVEDLKELESQGLKIQTIEGSEKTVKCLLYAIAGDNLGSHGIGGFLENFSRSEYFCRYCLISRDFFHQHPDRTGTPRSIDNYNETVKDLQEDNYTQVGYQMYLSIQRAF